jgi:AbrB family looped-hinge helix DNA binding protein
MKTIAAKFTTQGRITIPVEIRKKYKLTPGRRVKFEITDDGIRIIPLTKSVINKV